MIQTETYLIYAVSSNLENNNRGNKFVSQLDIYLITQDLYILFP